MSLKNCIMRLKKQTKGEEIMGEVTTAQNSVSQKLSDKEDRIVIDERKKYQ